MADGSAARRVGARRFEIVDDTPPLVEAAGEKMQMKFDSLARCLRPLALAGDDRLRKNAGLDDAQRAPAAVRAARGDQQDGVEIGRAGPRIVDRENIAAAGGAPPGAKPRRELLVLERGERAGGEWGG